jgi:hypothetical protein
METRFARAPRYFRAGARRLDGFQVIDEVVLLLLGQFQFEGTIVMVDDVRQGRESAIMIEAPFTLSRKNNFAICQTCLNTNAKNNNIKRACVNAFAAHVWDRGKARR